MDDNHKLFGKLYGNKKPYKTRKKYDIRLIEFVCGNGVVKKFQWSQVSIFHEFYFGKYPKEFSMFLNVAHGGKVWGQKKYLRRKDLKIDLKNKIVGYRINNYKHIEDNLIPYPFCKNIKEIKLHLTNEGVKKVENILQIHDEEDDLWYKKKSKKTSRKTSKKTSRKKSRKKSRKTSRKTSKKTSRKKSKKTSRKKSKRTSRKKSRKTSKRN